MVVEILYKAKTIAYANVELDSVESIKLRTVIRGIIPKADDIKNSL